MVWLGVSNSRGQPRLDAVDGQGLHDDAGRKRQHLFGRNAQRCCQRLAGAVRVRQALIARAGIGIAGIDDQGADGRSGRRQMRPAYLHGRGAETVLREHGAHAGACIQQKNGQILAVGFTNARFGDADAHPFYGKQVLGLGRGQMDGHGGSPEAAMAEWLNLNGGAAQAPGL